jgi:hypothetical protein
MRREEDDGNDESTENRPKSVCNKEKRFSPTFEL